MTNQYDIGDMVTIYGIFSDINDVVTDPTTISVLVKDPTGTLTTYVYGVDANLIKDSVGNYHFDITPTVTGVWYYKFVGEGAVKAAEEDSFFVRTSGLDATSTTETDLSYLLPYLRLKIGDVVPATYRYLDSWLTTALVLAIKELSRWWNFKYLVDENNVVTRNPALLYELEAPPVIQAYDEAPIIIMAALITLEGSLENSAWSTASWKDAEISYSNLEGGRLRDTNLKRLQDELLSLLVPPTKRLARARKGHLPGFKGNGYETNTQY